MDFKLNAPFQPTGDQPEAIRQLVEGVQQRTQAPGAAGRDRHR